MTLTMAYGVLMGGLFAGAAFFLDRGLRGLKRPTRWVWLLGMAGTALAPLLSLLPGKAPAPAPGGVSVPVDFLYASLSQGSGAAGAAGGGAALDGALVVVWVLSSALVFLGLGWFSLRLRRESRSWAKERMNDEEVLVSRGLGPAVLGVLRPAIVLPPWTLELDGGRLELILMHEREHRDARDPALLALGIVLLGFAPWNPGLWWMFRRFHLAVEADCDRRVLSRGVPPQAYGALLLDVASETRRLPGLVPALAEGGRTLLERRLSMLRGTVRKHRIGSAALALCAGLGFIALACETPTPPSSVELKVDFEASQVPAEVAEQGDGYFVFKKEGGKLEYVQPLAPDELSVLQESGERATFKAYEVAPSNEKTPPAGSVSLVREVSPEVISTLAKKGQPGEGAVVRLREAAEPGGATPAPLVIVDGVITGLSPGALSELSPKEIKSIEIIKGKAAESLYGERARGGVIQVTTKG